MFHPFPNLCVLPVNVAIHPSSYNHKPEFEFLFNLITLSRAPSTMMSSLLYGAHAFRFVPVHSIVNASDFLSREGHARCRVLFHGHARFILCSFSQRTWPRARYKL